MKPTFELPRFREHQVNRLVRIVTNADLRNSHDGLRKLAKNLRQDPDKLEAGECIIFINTAKTAIKMFASGSLALGYFKAPGKRRINQEVLRSLPRFFGGGEIRYDAALKELIIKEIRK